jgi:hypothetical protein
MAEATNTLPYFAEGSEAMALPLGREHQPGLTAMKTPSSVRLGRRESQRLVNGLRIVVFELLVSLIAGAGIVELMWAALS